MSISSLGLGAGIDSESIVTQLVALNKAPVDALATEKTSIQTSLTNYGKVQSYMSAVRDAARALSDTTVWNAATVASSDATTVAATVGTGASPGSYSLTVSQLATAQSAASTAVASPKSTIGQGSLKISLGAWGADGSFNAKGDATPVTITIGEGVDSLEKIRDLINSSGPGVLASIVTDASGSRLSLRSKDTGETSGFKIEATEGATAAGAPGLSSLAFAGPNATTGLKQTQTGQNAKATINGLAIESSTNSLTTVVDGLTLQLNKKTAVDAPIQITVAQDPTAVTTAVNAFATAYNNAMTYLRDQTKYVPDSKASGPLQGDRTAITLIQQLRTLAGTTSSASGVFRRLTDIGLEPQTDGTLKTNATKVTAAVSNMAELKKFFSASSTDKSAQGIGQQFKALTDSMLSSDGSISNRQAGLTKSISDNQSRQDTLTARSKLYETRLRAQYETLDTQMASLNALSTYVTAQLASLSSSKD
jgi:flagellar hook-associated protein 2